MSRLRMISCAVAMSVVATAFGQVQRNRRGGDFTGGPSIGESLVTADVYDSQGEPFDWERLRGKHTVLVFGCLT